MILTPAYFITGECDLVLIHAPEFDHGLDLDIHVRTTIQYAYSFISSAVLRIGNSILEIGSYGDYFLDGVSHADLTGASLSGYEIIHSHPDEKRHLFDIVLSPTEDVTVTTFKDIVSVSIRNPSKDRFGASIGLMGTFQDGTMVSRDGRTVLSTATENDRNAFGQEWQVRQDDPKLFQVSRAPQYPLEECRLPPTSEASSQLRGRRLLQNNISLQDAKSACDSLRGDSKQACIYDGKCRQHSFVLNVLHSIR